MKIFGQAFSGLLAGVLGVAGFAMVATPANAQATRTWVSGVGDDANPCSRTAPCKTFAGAISKTAAGGEINCLDPGGFGGVTITKAISIICDYTEGGVLVSGTNGVVVNAGANDVVILSGLDLEGAGTGLNGVRFIAGRSLHIRRSIISGFNSTAAGNGNGILFAPSGASELFVTDSYIVDNGGASNGGGIEVAPTGASGSARAIVRNVYLTDNQNIGIRLNTTGTTAAAGIIGSIDDVEVSGAAQGIVVFTPAGTTSATAMITNSTVANNTGFGILASGTTARARVGDTTITGNGTGVSAVAGSAVNSYGDNRLNGNTSDGAFTAPVIPEQ